MAARKKNPSLKLVNTVRDEERRQKWEGEGERWRTKPGRYVLFKRRDVEEYLEKNKKSI